MTLYDADESVRRRAYLILAELAEDWAPMPGVVDPRVVEQVKRSAAAMRAAGAIPVTVETETEDGQPE